MLVDLATLNWQDNIAAITMIQETHAATFAGRVFCVLCHTRTREVSFGALACRLARPLPISSTHRAAQDG